MGVNSAVEFLECKAVRTRYLSSVHQGKHYKVRDKTV